MQQTKSRLYRVSLVFLALLLAGVIVWYKFPYTADRYLPPEEKIQTIYYGTLVADGEFKHRGVYLRDRGSIAEFVGKFRDERCVRLLRDRNVINTTKSMIIYLEYVDNGMTKPMSLEISSKGYFSMNGGKKAYRLWSRQEDSLFTSLKSLFSDKE